VGNHLHFQYGSGCLFITLPSGRRLTYVKPRIEVDMEYMRDQLTYEGTDAKGWTRIPTYGGKLVENIVQAVARDCLAVSLVRVEDAGFDTVMHIHDEIVVEGKSADELAQLEALMSQPIDWAPGLPLRADGFSTPYYKKED
jgi:DNA polymerase